MASGAPQKRDLVVVGAIAGAHGVRGDVRVRSFTAEPDDVFAYGPLLAEDGRVVLEPRSVRAAKDHFIVTPAAPETREAWEAMKGTKLHVPRAALPAVDEDEFYIDDLVGLHAVGVGGAAIGRVKAVQNFGAGDLLEIQPAGGGKSVLVPFTEADVPTLDLEGRRLTIATWTDWVGEADDRE